MKSPVKNAKFKNLCLRSLKTLIPPAKIVESYLFFSGELELSLASYERFVIAHTFRPFVYEFWKCIEEDPQTVHEIVTHDLFKFDNQLTFNILQEKWHTYQDPYVRAAFFFLLNRCSDTGMISSGKLAMNNYTPFALNCLKTYRHPKNLHLNYVDEASFGPENLPRNKCDFVLLPIGDFSYNLFDHGKSQTEDVTLVDNRKIKEILEESPTKAIALYNKHSAVFDFYDGLNFTMIDAYGEQVENYDKCEEIIVTNF
jgi:hypothetical protein